MCDYSREVRDPTDSIMSDIITAMIGPSSTDDLSDPNYHNTFDNAHYAIDNGPPKRRQIDNYPKRTPIDHTFKVSEDEKTEFLKSYSEGAFNNEIINSNFDAQKYLELYLIANIENPFKFNTDRLDGSKTQFFRWIYNNKSSIDTKMIAHNLLTYIEDESHEAWNKKTELIDPEIIYKFMVGIKSLEENLVQIETYIRTNGSSHDFSISTMNKSVQNHIKQDLKTIIPPKELFNLLKQKCMNKYSPLILTELVELSKKHNSIDIYTDNILGLIESYSKEYKNRKLKGKLNDHKEYLQQTYNELGGIKKKDLFPVLIQKSTKNIPAKKVKSRSKKKKR
ncbi:MAG: hypothetical protein GQ477_06150 [Nanohaloarchaea archaeon]|nr:hypothetical protein [Candidatus Nanohaloarchaea archaeon]